MIQVRMERDGQGRVDYFRIAGHAGLAPHGSDIVCAAVSAIAQTMVYGMVKVLGIEPRVCIEDGLLECRLPPGLGEGLQEKAALLLETMAVGLQEIHQEYPGHIKILTEQRGGEKHEV